MADNTSGDSRELPQRHPGRAAQLGALDHLRTWCENEDAPAPTYVQSHSTITRVEEVDQATRFAMVDSFAARHEVKVNQGTHHYFASVHIYEGTLGVTITYALFAEYDVERPL